MTVLRRFIWRWAFRLVLAPWVVASLTACAPVQPTTSVPARALAALRPRTVLVYVDLSGSMRPDALTAPLARLARELRPRDRVVLYPITASTAADLAPALDTTLAGSLVEQLSAQVHLTTRASRAASAQQETDLARALVQGAQAAGRRYGETRATSILDAVCHAARVAGTNDARSTIALLLTDGQETLRLNLERAVPSPTAAARLGARLRADCDLGAPTLTLRLVGVRHPNATTALLAWWRALLPALGYHGAADDVATHRLRPLLLTP